MGDILGVRSVLIIGNVVGAEDMAKVSAVLGKCNVMDSDGSTSYVEVEMDACNGIAANG